jgi:O-antigen/teichoic acid export membrane protein
MKRIEMKKSQDEGSTKMAGPATAVAVESAPATSLTERAAWIMFAKTAAYVLSCALPLLMVRRLTQHEFGLYKQVFLVVGTAYTMLPLNFGMSAYYFLPREREHQRHIIFNVLLFYMLVAGLAALALIIWPSMLAAIFNSAELVALAPLIGIAILFWIISSFLEIIAIANQEAKLASAFIVISQFTKASLILGAALWFATIESLVYAAIVQGALQTAILLAYLQSRFPGFWHSFDRAVFGRQLSYALPLGFAGLLYVVQVDLHNYFVANRFDAATYAIYAIGCFQLPLVNMLSESVCSVMIPRVSLLQKQGDRAEIIRLTARVMRKLSVFYFPLFAFMMIAGREFLIVLFTEQYAGSWPIFMINLMMLPFSILVLDPIMRAYAEQRYFFLRFRIGLITILLVALWFGVRHLSLVGVISIVIAVSLIEHFVTAIRMGRVLGVRARDVLLLKDVGKVALATLAASGAALILKWLVSGAGPLILLMVCGVVFLAAYFISLVGVRVFTPTEYSAIRGRVERLRRRGSQQLRLAKATTE